MSDKRDTDRVPMRSNVRYGPDGPQYMGFTKNISPTGVRIECRKGFPKGTILHMTFGEEETVVMGKVMWSRDLAAAPGTMTRMYAMGIAFEPKP